MADWNEYFSKTRPPSNLDEAKRTIQDFAYKHKQLGRNIVLVTSGGTTVPIESNTVRFVDNFSQGTRGALSAEYFLMHGYAVIFLHRQRSYEPFCRHFEGHNALDLLELHLDTSGAYRVTVDETRAPGIQEIVRRYKEVQNGCLLLKIGFMTLSDYLFLLRASAEALSPLSEYVMFYLAAAVSDFYIPENEMSEHKIQSSQGGISLNMTPTPKMLSPLVKEWAKNAFVVSFKLETDVNIISRKAREALQKYNHQVVIANILQTRRKTVVLVTPHDEVPIWMSDQELEIGKEIEEKIINELTRRHLSHIAGNADAGNQQTSVVNNNLTFSPNQYQTQAAINQNNTVSTTMPGLAPINVYQASPVNAKTQQTLSNVLLQLKNGTDGEVDEEVLGPSLLKRGGIKEESGSLTLEMQEFIREFKARRVHLGYTQDDVGREMSALKGPTYSQSFISRFEGKQLGMKAAERMRPILEAWIQSKEEEHNRGNKFSKKRRKRTSFSPEYIHVLNEHFNQNPKPSVQEMQALANKINLDFTTVKVWFCNKKQSLKRLGQPVHRNTLRAEIDAKRKRKNDNTDLAEVFPLSAHGAVKTLLPVSTPTGTVTMPFFISQDGNPIPIAAAGTATNNSTVLPATQQGNVGTHLSTTLTQQIVHLSQLPILAPMTVVNNGNLTGGNEDGAATHILSNGRLIPSSMLQARNSVLQIQNETVAAQQLQQGNQTIAESVMITTADDLTDESQTLSTSQEDTTDNPTNESSSPDKNNSTIDESRLLSTDNEDNVDDGVDTSQEIINEIETKEED